MEDSAEGRERRPEARTQAQEVRPERHPHGQEARRLDGHQWRQQAQEHQA